MKISVLNWSNSRPSKCCVNRPWKTLTIKWFVYYVSLAGSTKGWRGGRGWENSEYYAVSSLQCAVRDSKHKQARAGHRNSETDEQKPVSTDCWGGEAEATFWAHGVNSFDCVWVVIMPECDHGGLWMTKFKDVDFILGEWGTNGFWRRLRD